MSRKKPKTPLESVEPFRSGPGGVKIPRCQKRSKRTKKQCGASALKGRDVCWTHGGGSPKRVKNGTKKDPRFANLQTGEHAQPETLAAHAKLNEDLAKREQEYLKHSDTLRNLDRLLARLWAVCDILSENRPEAVKGEYGESPPALLEVLKALGATLERTARIEGKIRDAGANVTINVVQVWVERVVDILHEFVPEDLRGKALDRFQAASGAFTTGEAAHAG